MNFDPRLCLTAWRNWIGIWSKRASVILILIDSTTLKTNFSD